LTPYQPYIADSRRKTPPAFRTANRFLKENRLGACWSPPGVNGRYLGVKFVEKQMKPILKGG
jgi:hypothetical protein